MVKLLLSPINVAPANVHSIRILELVEVLKALNCEDEKVITFPLKPSLTLPINTSVTVVFTKLFNVNVKPADLEMEFGI